MGPALLLQLDSTIVVPPGWGGSVDAFGNLVWSRRGSGESRWGIHPQTPFQGDAGDKTYGAEQ